MGQRSINLDTKVLQEGVRPKAADSPIERHQEWLIDESLDETFPASDPISPAKAQRRPTQPRTLR